MTSMVPSIIDQHGLIVDQRVSSALGEVWAMRGV